MDILCGINGLELISVITACITVYIAYRQWKNDKNRLKFELFDKRIKLYVTTKEIMTSARNCIITAEEIHAFKLTVQETKFLYGEEVYKYLNGVNTLVCNIFEGTYSLKEYDEPEQKLALIKKIDKDTQELEAQQDRLVEIFEGYLRIK